MHHRLPRVSPLTLRKKLLIAESELNRSQLMETFEGATEWHRTFSSRVSMFGSLASATALLASGFTAFRRKLKPQGRGKVSWVQPVIRGASLIASLCEAFRSCGATPIGEMKNPQTNSRFGWLEADDRESLRR